jgi:uncharacterized protein
MSPASVVPDWLAEAFDCLSAGDVDGWASIYAPDAVHELPFAARDDERRLEGRDAIAARLREVFDAHTGRLRFGTFDNVRVRQAGDEVIIEGDGHHRRAVDDAPVEIGCVWFITRRDGQVTHFRDYMNPLTLVTHELTWPSGEVGSDAVSDHPLAFELGLWQSNYWCQELPEKVERLLDDCSTGG